MDNAQLNERLSACKTVTDFCAACGIDEQKEYTYITDPNLDLNLRDVMVANHAANVFHCAELSQYGHGSDILAQNFTLATHLLRIITPIIEANPNSFPDGYMINTDAYHLFDQSDMAQSCENAAQYALTMMVDDLKEEDEGVFFVPAEDSDLSSARQDFIARELDLAVSMFGFDTVKKYTESLFYYEHDETGEEILLPCVQRFFQGDRNVSLAA